MSAKRINIVHAGRCNNGRPHVFMWRTDWLGDPLYTEQFAYWECTRCYADGGNGSDPVCPPSPDRDPGDEARAASYTGCEAGGAVV